VKVTSSESARERMVKEQIEGRGVRDPRVLDAMRAVPRERFVDGAQAERAYEDRPLPIGHGQTISQPYVVAHMCELLALRGGEKVLEIGAGCGYQTAVLASLAGMVYGVEIIPELARRAVKILTELRIKNAVVECFDGTHGWPEHQPYDGIILAAGAPRLPALLLAQLADGGRLVAPVGPREEQRLQTVRRRGDEFEISEDIPVRFVDLTGRYGWGGSGPASA
jgi:protein-L-isoaspartate(D-aspartate) O-methyltransferase